MLHSYQIHDVEVEFTDLQGVAFANYYYNFAGNPTLLARSSDDPITPAWEPDPDSTFIKYNTKLLYNVGSHKIVQIFDDGPRQDIRKILFSYDIPWLTVNVIRMGYSDTRAHNPVILLLTVEEGTNPLQAQNAALGCRDCLRRYEASNAIPFAVANVT